MQTKGGLAVCSVSDEENHRGRDGQRYIVREEEYQWFEAGNRHLEAVGGSSAASRLLAGFLALPHFQFKPRKA